MRYTAIILLAILVFASCKKTGHDDNFSSLTPLQADTTYSYFATNEKGLLVNNSYFKTYSYDLDNQTFTYVFKIEEHNRFESGNAEKKMKIRPVYSGHPINDWLVEFNPDEVTFKKNTLIAEMFGNDDHELSFRIINIDKGNTLIEYTYGNLEIQFPDAISKRYFGFYGQKGRPHSNFTFNQKDIVGYFTYASGNEHIQTIQIKATNAQIYSQIDQNSPMLEFDALDNNAILSTTARSVYYSGIADAEKEKNLINIGLKATFYIGDDYTPETIFFPVKGDKIDMEGILYNKNVFQLKFQ